MIVLGIETSCDDTAAAVLEGTTVRASVVSSQDAVHGPFGGIVPELASRHHLENVLPVIHSALQQASLDIDSIQGIAVTRGPGLVGSLLVGLSAAQGIAYAKGIPLVGVNHLEGHLLAIFLDRVVEFPYLALLVSGGHTSLVVAEEPFRYRVIGRTVDDAAGEAFDKGAKMLGLGFPGGREIDRLAREGDAGAVHFPRASVKGSAWDFSFSGLKTSLRECLRGTRTHLRPSTPAFTAAPSPSQLRDLAASFQEAIVDSLVGTTLAAATALGVRRIVVSGGVSANSRLRTKMSEAGNLQGFDVHVPSFRFCTDNAAMIAYAGALRLGRGESDSLAMNAIASLPL